MQLLLILWGLPGVPTGPRTVTTAETENLLFICLIPCRPDSLPLFMRNGRGLLHETPHSGQHFHLLQANNHPPSRSWVKLPLLRITTCTLQLIFGAVLQGLKGENASQTTLHIHRVFLLSWDFKPSFKSSNLWPYSRFEACAKFQEGFILFCISPLLHFANRVWGELIISWGEAHICLTDFGSSEASIYQLNVPFRDMHIYISGEIKFYRSVLVLLSNKSNNNL